MQSDSDVEKTIVKFNWQVMSFTEKELALQFSFDEPEAIRASNTEFYELQMTFWGTKYFKDTQEREVAFGTQIKWKFFRQMDEANM